MWRVFQIFHNPQPNRKVITPLGTIQQGRNLNYVAIQILSDWNLIAIVLAIVGWTILLLLFGEAVPYLRGVVALVQDLEHPQERNVRNSNNDMQIF